jgi:hypothetical protein
VLNRGTVPKRFPSCKRRALRWSAPTEERLGDLEEAGDADFLIGRTLRRNLRLPVSRVRKVTSENKIVLDLPAAEAKELGEKESLGEAAPGAGSMSENPGEEEKGAWGSQRESKLASPI